MSDKLERLKVGYLNLDSSDKQAFEKFIEDYKKKPSWEQRTFSESIKESFNKSLGPKMSSVCPCCGK